MEFDLSYFGVKTDADGNMEVAEGVTQTELLGWLLVEMRIQSHYLHQLPLLLNEGRNFKASDEPAKLRKDFNDGN